MTPTATPTPAPAAKFLKSVLVPNQTVDFVVEGSPRKISNVQFQLKLSNNTFHLCTNMPVNLTNGGRSYRVTLPSNLSMFPVVKVVLKAPGEIAQSSVTVKSTSTTLSRPQANSVCARLNAQLDW
jgi:hypothetical protein